MNKIRGEKNMPIIIDEKKKIFHLQTPTTSYVFSIAKDEVLLHLYYGKKIESIEGIENSVSYEGRPFSAEDKSIGIFTECVPQEYSFYGSCDFRKPAFHAQYADGSRITRMEFVDYKIIKGKPALVGLPSTYVEDDSEADTLEIKMKDKLTGLVLIYRYSVYSGFDAITRSVSAINEGGDDINIKSIMSMNIDFYSADYDFIHLSGTWARERFVKREAIGQSRIQVESRRGSSSHHHSPFIALAAKNADEKMGDVYGFSLVYSGNFEAGVEGDTYDYTRVYMGINSFDFNWLLKSGEEFHAPEVVMVYSANGLGDMSRRYHKLYGKRLCRGKYRDEERPVLINNWEGTYFDFDEEKIVNIAKTAQKAGIELMVLDDGWFGKRNNDDCSLGDWYENKEKLPDGIPGLAKKVTDLGMQFGLWFEPEMVSPDSDLYRAHPDWCLHVNGRNRSEGRNQLILDLSREDVCDYIIEFMTNHLKNAPISYIKWDMNRNMTEIGSALLPAERQAETAHRYMLGLYRVLEEITSQFPDVLFEGCSGGGGRYDAGMLPYFSQYWTSDDTDAGMRLYIQHGTSMVMPASTMGAHVSAVPNHQNGRVTTLKMRGDVAMCGQFGYELDVTKMTDDELAEIAEQIKYYKEIREVIHKGDMYRLRSPFEGRKTVWEYVSEDKKTVVLCRYTTESLLSYRAEREKLEGLDENEMYKRRDNGEVYGGGMLMNCGLLCKNQKDFESEIIIFDRL